MPRNPTATAEKKPVLDLVIARRLVIDSGESPLKKLLLLALLQRTGGDGIGRASQPVLSADCSCAIRTTSRLVPQLQRAAWFVQAQRGKQPSEYWWHHDGPLRDAWVLPGPRLAPATAETLGQALDDDPPPGPPARELARAVRILEETHAELRRSRREPRDVAGLPRADAWLAARWLVELAEQGSQTIEACALAVLGDWFRRPGSGGFLSARHHALALLCTDRGRDLHDLGSRYLAKRLGWWDDLTMRRSRPTRDPMLNAAGAAAVLAAIGAGR